MPKPHITLTPLSAFRPRRRTSFLIWVHSSLTLIHYSHSHPQVKIDRHSPSLPVRPGNSLKIIPGNLPDGKENNLRTIPSMRTVIYKPWRSPSVVLNKPYRQLSLPSPARRIAWRQKRPSTKFWPRNESLALGVARFNVPRPVTHIPEDGKLRFIPVSYTHLTLPTIYSV